MGGALRSLVAKMFASIGSFAVKIFGCGYAALGLNEFFNAMFRMKIFQIVVPVCVVVKTKIRRARAGCHAPWFVLVVGKALWFNPVTYVIKWGLY